MRGLGIPSPLLGYHTRRRQRRHVQGPRCSTSWPVQNKSTVMSVLAWFTGDSAPRAVFLALSSGPWFAASWPVWTRGTVCRCLYGLLVNLHLTLCFFLSSGPRCAVRVGVRIPLYGQGLCLSSWFWCSAPLCALICGYGLWARIALVSSVVLCSAPLRALVCGYGLWARDCACLSVVLVLSAIARVGMRIRLMGKDCACLSVVLVLSAIAARWYADTAFGQGLRLSLRGPGASCVQCRTSSTSWSAA